MKATALDNNDSRLGKHYFCITFFIINIRCAVFNLNQNHATVPLTSLQTADGNSIKLSQSDKWFKQAGIIDGKSLSTTDTGIAFRKVAK